nr:MAG TPA: hypothetical protein [Caudoviricetes sp.]
MAYKRLTYSTARDIKRPNYSMTRDINCRSYYWREPDIKNTEVTYGTLRFFKTCIG